MVVTFLVILIVSSVLVFDTFHVQMCWIFWLSKFGYLSVLSSLDWSIWSVSTSNVLDILVVMLLLLWCVQRFRCRTRQLSQSVFQAKPPQDRGNSMIFVQYWAVVGSCNYKICCDLPFTWTVVSDQVARKQFDRILKENCRFFGHVHAGYATFVGSGCYKASQHQLQMIQWFFSSIGEL